MDKKAILSESAYKDALRQEKLENSEIFDFSISAEPGTEPALNSAQQQVSVMLQHLEALQRVLCASWEEIRHIAIHESPRVRHALLKDRMLSSNVPNMRVLNAKLNRELQENGLDWELDSEFIATLLKGDQIARDAIAFLDVKRL